MKTYMQEVVLSLEGPPFDAYAVPHTLGLFGNAGLYICVILIQLLLLVRLL